MIEEFVVDRDDVRLFCKRYVPDEDCGPSVVRPPLLLLHGGLVDCDFFDGCGPVLARLYDVVTFDRRGYGRSGDPSSSDFSLETQAEDAAVVARLCFEAPCFLAAHSVGSSVAMVLMAKHPELVERALLYEPLVPFCLSPDSPLASAVTKVRAATYGGVSIGSIGDGFLFGLAPKDDRAYEPSEGEKRRSARNTSCSIVNEGDVFVLFDPETARSDVPAVVGLGEMDRLQPWGTMVKTFANSVDLPIVHFPGAHNCPADLPKEFAFMTAGVMSMQ